MEMALTEIFCSYYVNEMWKDAFLLTGNFRYLITVLNLTLFLWIESVKHLLGLKWQLLLNSVFVCQISAGQ